MATPLYPLKNKEIFEVIQFILDPKVIDGALRSAIHAHGPITTGSRTFAIIEQDDQGVWSVSQIKTCSTSSAAKRIRGAIRTRVSEYIKKKNEEKTQMWYNKLVGLLQKHRGLSK